MGTVMLRCRAVNVVEMGRTWACCVGAAGGGGHGSVMVLEVTACCSVLTSNSPHFFESRRVSEGSRTLFANAAPQTRSFLRHFFFGPKTRAHFQPIIVDESHHVAAFNGRVSWT